MKRNEIDTINMKICYLFLFIGINENIWVYFQVSECKLDGI